MNDETGPGLRTPIGPPPSPVSAAGAATPRSRSGLRTRLAGTRLKVAAAVAVVFLSGGAGGYAVVRAVGLDGTGTQVPGQGAFDRGDDGQRPDLGNQQDAPPAPRQDGSGTSDGGDDT